MSRPEEVTDLFMLTVLKILIDRTLHYVEMDPDQTDVRLFSLLSPLCFGLDQRMRSRVMLNVECNRLTKEELCYP